MSDFILNQQQLQLVQEKIEFDKKYELACETWNKFSEKEKEYVVEVFKFLYPEKIIKESKWYNTLGDIVGIFDPTGVVDFVNGISYIAQGDQLFGFLSMVSAVPYLGDAVAKPVMSALRVGGPASKGLKNVMALSKAGDTARAASELARISQTSDWVAKFVRGFGKIAGKLKEMVLRSPGGLLKGFKNTILQWIELFEKGAKAGKPLRLKGQQLASILPTLSKEQQLVKLKELKRLSDSSGFFKTYRTPGRVFSWKTIWGGLPQLMGRNRSVRALMRKSKWWLGFLDYLGWGNYVGPEELKNKLGDKEFVDKINQYQKTPEAQQNFADEYGADGSSTNSQQSSQGQQTSSGTQDPIKDMIQSLVLGRVKGSALGGI